MLTTMRKVGCGRWGWPSLIAAAVPGLGARRRPGSHDARRRLHQGCQSTGHGHHGPRRNGWDDQLSLCRPDQGGGVERRPVGARHRKTVGVAPDRHRAARAGRNLNFGTQASVQGQVGAPGVYTLDRPTNLTQLLSRAGGLRDAGLGGTITVRAPAARSESSTPRTCRPAAGPARICGSPTMMRFLWTWRHSTIYMGMWASRRISFASSSDGPASYFDWRRIVARSDRNGGSGSSASQANGQTYEVPASLDDQVEAGDTIIVNERIF